jgi:hypothetical protein
VISYTSWPMTPIELEEAFKLPELVHRVQSLQALCADVDHQLYLADKQIRRYGIAEGERHIEFERLRKHLHTMTVRCGQLERLDHVNRQCWHCWKTLPEDWDPARRWCIAHLLRYCSPKCFAEGCRAIFEYYIALHEETKGWDAARTQLNLVRRYLRDVDRRWRIS